MTWRRICAMMNFVAETSWERLHRIAEKRREELGMSRADLTAQGGPSSETLRGLALRVGAPTLRQRAALDALDSALGWDRGTSWDLAQPMREAMTPEFMADEEDRLVHAPARLAVDAHEQAIRDFGSMVQAALRKQPADEAEQMMVALMKVLNGWA